MFPSLVDGRVVDRSLLTKDVRPEYHNDLDYLVSMLDWEGNVNPEFGMSNRVFPRLLQPAPEAAAAGYREQWVCYGTPWYSAKELTVMPKRTVTIKDAAAYGLILTQGHGTIGRQHVSTPAMIRFGEMTEDELFVTAGAAAEGVRIENLSDAEPLVILKNFRPGKQYTPPA